MQNHLPETDIRTEPGVETSLKIARTKAVQLKCLSPKEGSYKSISESFIQNFWFVLLSTQDSLTSVSEQNENIHQWLENASASKEDIIQFMQEHGSEGIALFEMYQAALHHKKMIEADDTPRGLARIR